MTQEQLPRIIVESHEILGLKHPSTLKEVEAAHRRLTKEYHPDNKPEGERLKFDRLLLNVNVARDILRVFYTDPSAAALMRAQQGAAEYLRKKLLETAVYRKDSREIARLVKQGVDVNTNLGGTTALHLALDPAYFVTSTFLHTPSGQTLTTLLEHGANPNARDLANRTPLHVLCLNSDHESFSYFDALIKKGAHVNASDIEGKTPLDYLLDRSEETDVTLPGRRLLHVMTRLFQHGARFSPNFNRIHAVVLSELLHRISQLNSLDDYREFALEQDPTDRYYPFHPGEIRDSFEPIKPGVARLKRHIDSMLKKMPRKKL